MLQKVIPGKADVWWEGPVVGALQCWWVVSPVLPQGQDAWAPALTRILVVREKDTGE